MMRLLSIPWVRFSLLILGLDCAFPSFSVVRAEEQPVIFSRDVLPILADNCFQCHGPDPKEGRQGDLRLDDEQDVKRDRGGYFAVKPGELQASELFQRITSTDPDMKMPPAELNRTLSAKDITTLEKWIEQGAQWGKHWAFERVERPAIEDPKLHPIDALVGKVQAQEGITPNERAARETLIRRLSLDLTGLPPTPEQIDQFLADTKPGSWERLVDRTLASPSFGERMAWDWLEAARYADSNGYQGDNDRTMWPWRDWVVTAFNENLPYDQFTIWQLAGDQLPNPTHEQILATGFNRNHMINGEGGRIAEENRVDYVMDMAETTGTVWLGLTFNCCRCHDHKFDPIQQSEYYQLTAFFNQTLVDGGGGNPQTPPILEAPTPEQQAALQMAEAAWNPGLAELAAEDLKRFPREKPEDPITASPAFQELPEPIRQSLQTAAGSRKMEDWDRLRQHFEEPAPEYAARLKSLRDLKQQIDGIRNAIPKVMVMKDRDQLRPTFILNRGLYNEPGEEVSAGTPAILPPLADPEQANRLDLARWLVSRDNPLMARVAVNRFWQMFFGIGLVKTSEDFGVQGEYPVHRELLDWLAAEFMESGWNVKHLIRLIVTSETYQRSSQITNQELFERDPQNRLLARGPRYRLPSWMIRDQALAAAGLLSPTVGGKPVYPYQPEGVWAEVTFGNKVYRQDQGAALYRRSIYTFWRRIIGPPIFFDTAKRQVCEVKPLRTNTPMHALTTLNDVTYVEAARVLAEKLLKEAETDEARMQLVARRLLARNITPEEQAIWQRSLDRALTHFTADPEAAREFLSHGASKSDPALKVEQHAAWTALCLNLLNLDETLTKE